MTAATFYKFCVAAMLAGLAAHKYAVVRKPVGVAEYHQRVRDAAKQIPRQIAGWVGQDAPVPPQAIKVLDPNVIVSRSYTNAETGLTVGLLFVHCADAHDMAGHFPVRCYPARGWDLNAARPCDWTARDLKVGGMEYQFSTASVEGGRGPGSIVVANCLLRPAGRIYRDMDAMTRSIVGAGGQSSGAAQVQVTFNADVPQHQREAAVAALMTGYRPLIDAVLEDPSKP
jgi:hypothetical protein